MPLDEKRIYCEFAKIDAEQRTASGWASTEKRDQQGEIVRRSAIEAALPSYLQYPTIREMHQPSAVGKAIETDMRDKGFWLGAKVVDDRAWLKVKEGVYRGFSIGGRVTSRDPDDPSIITGLDLTEVSLVDRPANPEASFMIVKRARDGKLLFEPTQVWACGDGSHQHFAKEDAAVCMMKRSEDKAHDEIEKANQHRRDSGAFTNAAGMAEEANAKASFHDEMAARADVGAKRHRQNAATAEKNKDATALTIHDSLAQRMDALSSHHKQAAGKYRALAASYSSKAETEKAMTTTTTADVVKEAADVVASLAKAITDEPTETVEDIVSKAADPMDEAHSAHMQGVEADDASTNAMIAATQAKMRAGALRADGKGDEADHANAEASAEMTAAEHHASAAASYHDLTAHRIQQPANESLHGANEDGTSKADGSVHGENEDKWTQKVGEIETYHKQMKDKNEKEAAVHKQQGDAAKLAKSDAIANFHFDVAKKLTDRAAKHAKFLEGYEKLRKSRLPKVVAKADMKLGYDGFDRKTAIYFGKRDFSDKKRQELADSGAALPDGSYPIENKSDLQNAIQAVGRAKDPDKAKAHIKARAKALNAESSLPDSWSKADKVDINAKHEGDGAVDPNAEKVKKDASQAPGTAVSDGKTETTQTPEEVKPGEIVASLENEAKIDPNASSKADTKCAEHGVMNCDKCMAAKAANPADVKCPNCGHMNAADAEKCKDCDKAMGKAAKKADLSKGLYVIGQMANLLAQIEQIQSSSAIEQLMEGDATDTTPDKLQSWLDDGCDLLRDIVTNETSEIMSDEDIDVIAMAATSAYTAIAKVEPWHRVVAKAIRATISKEMTVAERMKRKAAAEKVDGLVAPLAKADAASLATLYDTLVKAGLPINRETNANAETVTKIAAITSERDTVTTSLSKMTQQIIPLVREVQAIKKSAKEKDEAHRIEMDAVKAELAKVSKTVVPGKGKIVNNGLAKADDTGNGQGKSGVLEALREVPPGHERAQAILDAAHGMRR